MAYGYIYKTKINNKNSSLDRHFYIGQHRCGRFDSKYFGSGVKIKQYIKKYGRVGLSVEIIEWANDPHTLNQLESKYVDEGMILDDLCLNLVTGGKYKTWSIESRKKASLNMLGVKNHRYGKKHTEQWKREASIRGKLFRHTEDSIAKIRNTKRSRPHIYTDEQRKKMSDKASVTKNATGYKWTKVQIENLRPKLILSERKIRKIPNKDLPYIDTLLRAGVKQKEIAKKYGVSAHAISWINTRRIPEFKKIKPEIFHEK